MTNQTPAEDFADFLRNATGVDPQPTSDEALAEPEVRPHLPRPDPSQGARSSDPPPSGAALLAQLLLDSPSTRESGGWTDLRDLR